MFQGKCCAQVGNPNHHAPATHKITDGCGWQIHYCDNCWGTSITTNERNKKAMRKEMLPKGWSKNPNAYEGNPKRYLPSQDGSSGAICGDGMCPYNPCAKFPECDHVYHIIQKTMKDIYPIIHREKKPAGTNHLSCLHHFAICEKCKYRFDILKLINRENLEWTEKLLKQEKLIKKIECQKFLEWLKLLQKENNDWVISKMYLDAILREKIKEIEND